MAAVASAPRPAQSGAIGAGSGRYQVHQFEHAFDDDPWFAALDRSRRAALLARCRTRHARDGEALYTMGAMPDGLYGLVTGQVQLVNYPVLGKQLISIVVQQGSWFGELSVLDGKPRPNDAMAVGDATLLLLPMAAFHQLVAQDPEHYRDVALLICERSRWAAENLTSVLTSSAEARLARILLSLSRGVAGRGADVHLNQDDLAGMVGVTRQRVNTLLRKLEQQGVITLGYARVGIIDRTKLSQL